SHFTCGLASTTYWEAAKAGVDIIDTAISPFAHATSQPATETMIEMFKGTEWDLGLDLDKYIPLVDHFRKVKQQIAEEFNLKPNHMHQ
ncbi:Conserved carboxylase region, partial [human gut metagenome]